MRTPLDELSAGEFSAVQTHPVHEQGLQTIIRLLKTRTAASSRESSSGGSATGWSGARFADFRRIRDDGGDAGHGDGGIERVAERGDGEGTPAVIAADVMRPPSQRTRMY